MSYCMYQNQYRDMLRVFHVGKPGPEVLGVFLPLMAGRHDGQNPESGVFGGKGVDAPVRPGRSGTGRPSI